MTAGPEGAARVRGARLEDWPRVSRLLADLGRPDPSGDDGTLEAAFRAYLGRPDTAALVAEIDGRVVGFVDVEFRQRLNFQSPQAWVPDLIVDGSKRRGGVGRALLDEAERLAKERGCWGISLESAAWRKDAHAFYEALGWSGGAFSFSKDLSGQPWPPPPPSEG